MARKDLSPFGMSKGLVRKLTKVIGFADLTAAAANEDIACGTIPAGALVLGAQVKTSIAFATAGAETFDLDDLKVGGTDIGTEELAQDADLSSIGTLATGLFREISGAVLANIAASAGNVSAATAGSTTVTIYYVEAAVEQPS